MALYSVHLPPGTAPGGEGLLKAVFLREGFSWGAFVFGPLYLLAHRLWFGGAAILALTLAVGGVGAGLSLPDEAMSALAFLPGLIAGFESQGWRRGKLERRGFAEIGVVSGSSRREAELRFFARFSATGRDEPAPTRQGDAPGWVPPAPAGVLGLFPQMNVRPGRVS